MSAWAKTLLRRRLGGPFWVLRCAARLPGVGSMSTLTAPAKEQRWSTCRPCSVRRHAPASTAAGPCYNIIHEPTGLLNDTEDLPTDVANVLHRPETADNANPLLFHYYSIGVTNAAVLRHYATDETAVFVATPMDSLR